MTDETLVASLKKMAGVRDKWSPKQIAWESPRGGITSAPIPFGAGDLNFPVTGANATSFPTFTTSNTTAANYYNAAATASGTTR